MKPIKKQMEGTDLVGRWVILGVCQAPKDIKKTVCLYNRCSRLHYQQGYEFSKYKYNMISDNYKIRCGNM